MNEKLTTECASLEDRPDFMEVIKRAHFDPEYVIPWRTKTFKIAGLDDIDPKLREGVFRMVKDQMSDTLPIFDGAVIVGHTIRMCVAGEDILIEAQIDRHCDIKEVTLSVSVDLKEIVCVYTRRHL